MVLASIESWTQWNKPYRRLVKLIWRLYYVLAARLGLQLNICITVETILATCLLYHNLPTTPGNREIQQFLKHIITKPASYMTCPKNLELSDYRLIPKQERNSSALVVRFQPWQGRLLRRLPWQGCELTRTLPKVNILEFNTPQISFDSKGF